MAREKQVRAADTGRADASGLLALANTGVINGGVTFSPPKVPRSGYLLQVEAIAAAEFEGRRAELGAMAAFCTAEQSETPAGSYWRWLAPAWAGKSALMAHFVLHPPPGVDIVSFFITARLARQNDRSAFCEVVQRQLYALIGEEEPMATAYGGDEQLRLALDRAARVCAERRRRLVLVIDGLDEDRGVTSGPESHSIAALLPRTPPAGMRIILAGRPHPPVPDDVPAGHALRDTGIDHFLEASPYAQAVRVDAERDLLRLLNDEGLGRDVVGLLAAAGGGLSAPDLARLTDTSPRLIERELNAASGRGFRVRAAHWAPQNSVAKTDSQVYLLAHEEIQQSAMELLPEAELDVYRERLHAWADSWRRNSWSEETPEYLLRGYTQLLRERGDTARMVLLACDSARHERLWRVSGSDLEALTEIAGAFELIGNAPSAMGPDVDAAVRLAVHRDALHDRTEQLPSELIALWAQIGQIDRAVNLADSQRTPYRELALGAVAEVIAATGHRDRVLDLVAKITEDGGRSRTVSLVSVSAARAGHNELALELADTVEDPEERVGALASVARSLALRGRHDLAVRVVDMVVTVGSLCDGQARVAVNMATAAGVLLLTGRTKAGSDLLGTAVSHVEEIPEVYDRARKFAGIATELASCNQYALAVNFSDHATGIFVDIEDLAERKFAVTGIAEALAISGRIDKAVDFAAQNSSDDVTLEELIFRAVEVIAGRHGIESALALAESIGDTYYRTCAVAIAATQLFMVGQHGSALDALERVAGSVAAIGESTWQVKAMVAAARAFWAMGFPDRASDLTNVATGLARIEGRPRKSGLLAAVVEALVQAGLSDQAIDLTENAVEFLFSHSPATFYAGVLDAVEVSVTLHAVGLSARAAEVLDQAQHLAETSVDSGQRAGALTKITEGLVATGDRDRALRVALRAADLAFGVKSPFEQASCLTESAWSFAAVGSFDEAMDVVGKITDPVSASAALETIVQALSTSGDHERAIELSVGITLENEYDAALVSIVEGLATAGAFDRAGQVAESINFEIHMDRASVAIVQALATAGRRDEAVRRVGAIHNLNERGKALAVLAAAQGPTAEGQKLLAEALSYTRWDCLVKAIGSVAPQNLALLVTQLKVGKNIQDGYVSDT
ncbi:hypothetical protein [Streptomyces lasiicapitis]|uniref:hypothetical protein n=1 Tax=Streptomyces lasiicapitis TaxID=1923961 RepID=UPI0036ADA672